MQGLVDRGTNVYLIYSGSFLADHNYAGQLRDAFGTARFLDHVRCDFMPEVDHTVTALASQRKVLAAVREWALSLPTGAGATRTGAGPAPPAHECGNDADAPCTDVPRQSHMHIRTT